MSETTVVSEKKRVGTALAKAGEEPRKRGAIKMRTAKSASEGRIKLLVAVVSQNDALEITEICNREGASLNYSFEGFGTARTAILDYLGLGETEKRVVVSLIPESAEKAILDGIQKEMSLYLVGKGICFTLPLTAASSIVANGLLKGAPKEIKEGKTDGRKGKMKVERTYDLIVVAVQDGYADEAMNAAREAGAAGGTLIRAATLNNQKAEQLIGVTLQKETEILMILTKSEGKAAIMRAVQETAGLKTDAGGVLFSLPVDNLVGVGGGTQE
ncbi:MAG: hypothetical protein IJY62_05010 [Clostridia bacterium]|nr:hypothetical protein [Clostridia bacterium]